MRRIVKRSRSTTTGQHLAAACSRRPKSKAVSPWTKAKDAQATQKRQLREHRAAQSRVNRGWSG